MELKCLRICIAIMYQSPINKQLDETKMSENKSDYCNSQSALGVNLIDEKDELNTKLSMKSKQINETSIIYACSMWPANFFEKSNLFIHFTAMHETT